jgi:hypothetical protein
MIDRKAMTVFGAERRLRVYPHISSRPDLQVITRLPRFSNSCKEYFIMQHNASKFSHFTHLNHPDDRLFERSNPSCCRSVRSNPHPPNLRHGSIDGFRGIVKWPDRPDRSRIHTITYIGANSPTPLSGDCAPPVQNKNRFHIKKNRPFLTRLVGDPIGKEADRETNIGDKKNVTKCIN